MSSKFLSNSNVNNGLREIPSQPLPVLDEWTRPTDWVALPPITSTDNKFVGIFAVYNASGNNYVSLTINAVGGYTVDWGDGSSPQNYASASTATYQYTYSTVTNPVTSKGYKTVAVTVTPTVPGNALAIITTSVKPAVYPGSAVSIPWLEYAISAPSCTNLNLTGGVLMNMVERVQILSCGITVAALGFNFNGYINIRTIVMPNQNLSSVTGNFLFANCTKLTSIINLNLPNTVLTTSMFQNCSSLQVIPQAFLSNVGSTGTGLSDLSNMFAGCVNLQNIPDFGPSVKFTSAGGIFFDSMFSGCVKLVKAPFINTPSVGTFSMNNMFANCWSLTTIPLYNTATCTGMNAMFQNCFSLKTVPLLNSSNVTNMGTMFQNCNSLTSVPQFNMIKNLTTSAMFSGCSSLTTIPTFNTSNVGVTTNMFANCQSLQSVPAFDTSNVTVFQNMFLQCTSLQSIPTLNTNKGTTLSTMFDRCTSLTTIDITSTANATTVTGLANGCSTLTSITNNMDLGKVTTTGLVSLFQGCSSLQTAPISNIGPTISSLTSIFSGCAVLTEVPLLNVPNVTVTTTMVGSAFSLGRSQLIGLKVTHSYSNARLGRTELQEIFTNLASIPGTTQGITITGNPGADTPVAKTGTWGGTGFTITSTTTNLLSVGMWVAGTGINGTVTVTIDATADTITLASSKQVTTGTPLSFSVITTTTGISVSTIYYALGTGTTVQISATPGGAPINMTNNGTGTISYGIQIASIIDSTTLTLSASPSSSGAGSGYTARLLNFPLATLKNWTVTG